MSPLELLEYVAAGRPVEAVDATRSARCTLAVVLVGEDVSFADAVGTALGRGPLPGARQFVSENSCSARFDALVETALA